MMHFSKLWVLVGIFSSIMIMHSGVILLYGSKEKLEAVVLAKWMHATCIACSYIRSTETMKFPRELHTRGRLPPALSEEYLLPLKATILMLFSRRFIICMLNQSCFCVGCFAFLRVYAFTNMRIIIISVRNNICWVLKIPF